MNIPLLHFVSLGGTFLTGVDSIVFRVFLSGSICQQVIRFTFLPKVLTGCLVSECQEQYRCISVLALLRLLCG